MTDVLSLSLQASQCFSFVLLTFIWSNFLLFLLVFRFREIAVFPHALIRNVLLCVFKSISWPRKSGCLKMPSPPCCLLTKGNEHLEHYIFSLLSWMGRGTVGRNRCCKPEYTAPWPLGVSCNVRGLPLACWARASLPEPHSRKHRLKNTGLPVLQMVDKPTFISHLLMADESTGEDWDGSVTWVIDLLLTYSWASVYGCHQTHYLQGIRVLGWICHLVSHGVQSPVSFLPRTLFCF